jgi:pimeloyl-ACP methyl ester carboxylesterase
LERYKRLQSSLFASRRLDFTERDVQIPSLSLSAHIVEIGAGEPLLLIHGGNGVGAQWLPLVTRLPGRRLIVPDRPGCGLTDSFLYDGVDLRSHGAHFVEGVLDALSVERASIVGNSMGGYFALCFALAHPDRVHKLILAGGPAFSAGYQPLSGEAIEARVKGSRQPGRAGLGALTADPARIADDLLELLDTALAVPGSEESWRSIWRSARPDRTTFSLHAELEGLLTPTLLIWGEQDRIDPPQPAAIAISQRLPNARLVLMSEAGHLPWLDKPGECATQVTEFLVQA